MKYGHIKLSRKAFAEDVGDPFWHEKRTFSKWEAWVDLLQLAQWRAKNHAGVQLQRGEFVASVRTLGKRWGWSKSRVDRWLLAVEKSGRITGQRASQHGRVYLIAKYDTYQGNSVEAETDSGTPDGTEAGQQRDKNKQEKQSSKKDSFPNAVYEWLQREWFARFGVVAPMQFRVGIKALLVQGVRPGQLARAFAAYREDRNHAKKDGTFAWFLGDVQRHIAEGDLCSIQLMPPDAFGLTQAEANVKIAAHQERLKQQDDALYQRILSGQVAA